MNMVGTSIYLYLPQFLSSISYKEPILKKWKWAGCIIRYHTSQKLLLYIDIVMEWLYYGLAEVTIWKWLYPGMGHHFLRLSTHSQRLKIYIVLQQVEYLGLKAKGEKRSGLAYHCFQWPTEECVPPKSAALDGACLGILFPEWEFFLKWTQPVFHWTLCSGCLQSL